MYVAGCPLVLADGCRLVQFHDAAAEQVLAAAAVENDGLSELPAPILGVLVNAGAGSGELFARFNGDHQVFEALVGSVYLLNGITYLTFSHFLPSGYFADDGFHDNVYSMSNDPRAELVLLTAALEEHLTAITNSRGEHDASIDNAYVAIANAFERYEEALFDAYEEVTPLEVFIEDEDEEDDDFDYDFEGEDDDAGEGDVEYYLDSDGSEK